MIKRDASSWIWGFYIDICAGYKFALLKDGTAMFSPASQSWYSHFLKCAPYNKIDVRKYLVQKISRKDIK
jgi:hypothetical protein